MGADAKILDRLVKNMKKRGEDPLTPLLDKYFMDREAAEDRLTEYYITLRERVRPGGRFSPSSIGGCKRQAAFKFVRMPGIRRINPDQHRVFDHGNWIHHKWQANFLDMEKVLGRDKFKVLSIEGSVTMPELYIAGNSDAVIRIVHANGKKRKGVVDIKSINDRGFSYITREDAPMEEHVQQLTTYGEGLMRDGSGVTVGYLLYENKDNQQTRVFVVEFQNAVWQDVQEWVEECLIFLNEEALPPMHPDCDHGNMLFERCPYTRWCFGSKTPVKIRKRMYRDFKGVDEEWKDGLRAVEAG